MINDVGFFGADVSRVMKQKREKCRLAICSVVGRVACVPRSISVQIQKDIGEKNN